MTRRKRPKQLSGEDYTTDIRTPHYFVRESTTESVPTIVRKLSAVKLRKEQDRRLVRRFADLLDAGELIVPTLHEEATLRELRTLVNRRVRSNEKRGID